MDNSTNLETIISLAKRRGFVFQASDIYGGLSGFWDFGPYGASLVKNIKDNWWRRFVNQEKNIVGVDTAIIQNPKLWEASGHVETFVDPMVDCKECKHRYRADELAGFEGQDLARFDQALSVVACPECGKTGKFTPARPFQMMFKTNVGPVEDSANVAYLRPEITGGVFAQYALIQEASRQKLPFGIAQIGKAFRNEITPKDFIFRMREFEQMEVEYFTISDSNEAYQQWRQYALEWLQSIGLPSEKLTWHEHEKGALAHYAKAAGDIEYAYPFGARELAGVHNRSDYDLSAHSKYSGRDLSYFDEISGKKIIPHTIEFSIGISRLVLALLHAAYSVEDVDGEQRTVLRLHPEIAPVQVAVLPLSKNEELLPVANEVWQALASFGQYRIEYDETQSIGRRYRRQDEIGTPICVTVDFESLKDRAVTIRHRDSMKQERVSITELVPAIKNTLVNF